MMRTQLNESIVFHRFNYYEFNIDPGCKNPPSEWVEGLLESVFDFYRFNILRIISDGKKRVIARWRKEDWHGIKLYLPRFTIASF